jgi:predicted DNA-binding antitoxin AbrB/MazE fold protein
VATIIPEGEKVKKAVKWISEERSEDETKRLEHLIQKASAKFNLSPKEEEFLCVFYKNNR